MVARSVMLLFVVVCAQAGACGRTAPVGPGVPIPEKQAAPAGDDAAPSRVVGDPRKSASTGYGAGLDLAGFTAVTTSVVRDGGREWLMIEGPDGLVRLAPVPPVPAEGACSAEAQPLYLGFETTPPTRLALRPDRVVLERETERCWVEIPPPAGDDIRTISVLVSLTTGQVVRRAQ